MTDTIYAVSSGSPPAAIAVIRISGPNADGAVEALAGTPPPPRRASLRTLRRGDEVLDTALILRFPGPNTATGEDIAELHVHGGRAVVAAVLAALGDLDGLRAAEPGEFTQRAFRSGRLDLAEAEGLADLLSAETQAQRRAALTLARGALSRQIDQWQSALLALSAALEAALDFADEGDVGEALPPAWHERSAALADEIAIVIARPPAERLRDGIRVVIAGPPNAGKSSLLNALVGREAAITSSIPGTTRDLVEAPAQIGGTAFLLTDTAGLRESGDPIEAIGVGRALDAVAAADIVLWLGAAEELPPTALLIRAKADLFGSDPDAEVSVSAATGEGMSTLVNLLIERSRALLPGENEVAINARHRAVLAEAEASLREALTAFDLVIAAEAMRRARHALDRVTGRSGVEDMLDALFGRFCIGK